MRFTCDPRHVMLNGTFLFFLFFLVTSCNDFTLEDKACKLKSFETVIFQLKYLLQYSFNLYKMKYSD